MCSIQINLGDLKEVRASDRLSIAATLVSPTVRYEIVYYENDRNKYFDCRATKLPDGYVLFVVETLHLEEWKGTKAAPLIDAVKEMLPGPRSEQLRYTFACSEDAIIILAKSNGIVTGEDILSGIDYRSSEKINIDDAAFAQLFGAHFPAELKIKRPSDVLTPAKSPLARLLRQLHEKRGDDTALCLAEIIQGHEKNCK